MDEAVWRPGLPPGDYYEGMTADYEATLAVAGGWWHRRRSPEEREQYLCEHALGESEAGAGSRTQPLAAPQT